MHFLSGHCDEGLNLGSLTDDGRGRMYTNGNIMINVKHNDNHIEEVWVDIWGDSRS